MERLHSEEALQDYREIQLSALKQLGNYSCGICEEQINYQARQWAFCSNCGEIAHPACLSQTTPYVCFYCRLH